jgi:hypothetical protein
MFVRSTFGYDDAGVVVPVDAHRQDQDLAGRVRRAEVSFQFRAVPIRNFEVAVLDHADIGHLLKHEGRRLAERGVVTLRTG